MRKNIYSVHFCISLVTRQKRETGEKKQRDSGARVCVCVCERGGAGERGWLMLTESDRGERAAGFVFPADPNTESFLTRPTRHGVTE